MMLATGGGAGHAPFSGLQGEQDAQLGGPRPARVLTVKSGFSAPGLWKRGRVPERLRCPVALAGGRRDPAVDPAADVDSYDGTPVVAGEEAA